MTSLYKNYKTKIILIVFFSLLTILSILNIATYSMIKNTLIERFCQDAKSLAISISQTIEQDIDEYKIFLNERILYTDYHNKMMANFKTLKLDNPNIKFIYTTNRIDETTTEFILDVTLEEDPNSIPGIIELENTTTLEVYNTKTAQILSPTDSIYGVLLGGAAPIFDKENNVIGTVGVDICLVTVYSTLENFLIILFAISLSLLISITLLTVKLSEYVLDSVLKDKLTGAYSKRYSNSLLQKCIDNALKLNRDLSIMMLDLDHFKKVNDTYGHQFGDFVLTSLSSLIIDCLRQEDILVRYGGEEFLTLLLNLNADQAVTVAERIRKKVESYEIFNRERNVGIKMTLSIGVTSLQNREITATELISTADKALYKAKETRNAVVLLIE